MTNPLPRVLVAGVSVRSIARSAIAAGYDVLSADGYGDRDLLEPETLLFSVAIRIYEPFTIR